jgi:dTDP-4-dehydrorhamnose reductase
MTRWLVTGAGGMLGQDLTALLAGADVTGLDRSALEIRPPPSMRCATWGLTSW